MSLLNIVVEVAALLFVGVATACLPRLWRLNRLPRPYWFLWGESGWIYSNRAIVPILGAGWGFAFAFPAALFADDSAFAMAIMLLGAGWIVLCLALSGVLGVTGRPAALSPPAWR